MCAISKPKPTVQYVSLPIYFCFPLVFHIFCFCLQSMLQLKELLPISYLKDTLVNSSFLSKVKPLDFKLYFNISETERGNVSI